MSYVMLYNKTGDMPCEHSILEWEGEGLTLTGMKCRNNSDDIIIRWVNMRDKASVLLVKKNSYIKNIYRSNVIEEKFYILN